MRKIVKLAIGNALVLLAIVLAVNLIASVILDGQYEFERVFLAHDARAELPNYSDRATAEQIFVDFDALQTHYVPYMGWSRRPTEFLTTTVNSEGDRVHTRPKRESVGVVRFFGGSTMWGTGSEDDGTIPAHFNALVPDFEVHNHGESGFMSRQELARLVNLLNQREPTDLVVFYDGNNDTASLCRPDVEINGHKRAATIERRVNPSFWVLKALMGSTLEVLAGNFFRAYVYRTQDRVTRCQADPDYARRAAETLVMNWKLARAMSGASGAEFIAILQPESSVGAARVDHLARDWTLPEGDIVRVYPHVQEIVRREGLDWVHDFTHVFDGDEYIFIDRAHVSENGNKIVAEHIRDVSRDFLRRIRAQRVHSAGL